MITAEIMDAIDLMIDLCTNVEQVAGMKAVREMLADYDETNWLRADEDDRRGWIETFRSWT